MATYYVDLDLPTNEDEYGGGGTTAGDGSAQDPFNAKSMWDITVNDLCQNGDIFKMKGTYSGFFPPVYVGSDRDVNFEAWSLELYGPWKLIYPSNAGSGGEIAMGDWSDTQNPIAKGTLRDGIIILDPTRGLYLHVDQVINMVIQDQKGDMYIDTFTNFTNCTIISPGPFSYESYNHPNAITFENCVIDVTGFTDDHSDLTTTVATSSTFSIADPGITSSNSTFEWVVPTWPTQDSDFATWESLDLPAGAYLTQPPPAAPVVVASPVPYGGQRKVNRASTRINAPLKEMYRQNEMLKHTQFINQLKYFNFYRRTNKLKD